MVDQKGSKVMDDHFYIIVYNESDSVDFVLPEKECGTEWHVSIYTAKNFVGNPKPSVSASGKIQVMKHSVMVFKI